MLRSILLTLMPARALPVVAQSLRLGDRRSGPRHVRDIAGIHVEPPRP